MLGAVELELHNLSSPYLMTWLKYAYPLALNFRVQRGTSQGSEVKELEVVM